MLLHIADLEVEVAFKRIRNLRLRICPPDGQIKLSIPQGISLDRAETFLLEQRDWIIRHREVVKARQASVPGPAKQYAEREYHPVWGKSYLITLIPVSHSPRVELRNGWLRLHIPSAFTLEDRKTLVQTWEQNLMLAAIPPLINYWEPIMGDGTRFYALMNRFLPDWRERESRLNHPPLR